MKHNQILYRNAAIKQRNT